jgi:hypothetical protein
MREGKEKVMSGIIEECTLGPCRLILGDCLEVLPLLARESIDCCVTSPPYDTLRTYQGHPFEFEPTATAITSVLRHGGVLVWVVGDETKNGSETGTSFRQALYFHEVLGLNLHDTMIYQKANPGGARGSIYGYWQAFEFMFVFSKGTPKTFNPLCDRINQKGETLEYGGGRREHTGVKTAPHQIMQKSHGRRTNIWSYPRGDGAIHPAVYPLGLARDHILSWSNPQDTILDPFMGSGTTGVACVQLGRAFIGIEIVEDYYRLACAQLTEALRQLPLFPVSTQARPPTQEPLFIGHNQEIRTPSEEAPLCPQPSR